MRQHWAATGDRRWLCQRRRGARRLVAEMAQFWSERVQFNRSSRHFELLDVMGPDEDRDHVSNNVYTNVAVGLALFFAE